MLHLGSNAGFDLLGFQVVVIQYLSGAGSLGYVPGNMFTVLMTVTFLDAKVTSVTEDTLFITVQQITGRYDVVNIGSGGIYAVNQSERVVDSDMHLHTEVPLVAFLGLVHFRIALAAVVLSGARGRDDGGINNTPFTQHQTVLLQVLVHLFEQRLSQSVLLQNVAEIENGCFVRQTIQLQTCEMAHRLDFVQCILHRWVAEVIKQLHEVNAKHGRQRIRRPTILALGVITGYLLLQLLPRNQLVHALQKYLATRLALLGLVLGFGEGDLIHGSNESYRFGDGRIIADFGELFRPSLVYVYKSKHFKKAADDESSHTGAAEVQVSRDADGILHMTGYYWTARNWRRAGNTAGILNLVRLS